MTTIKLFNIQEAQIPIAKKWGEEHRINILTTPDRLTLENVDRLSNVDGIVLCENKLFNPKLYLELKKQGINHIVQRTAGYENFDLKEAKQQGVLFANVPDYSPESIAEYTLSLALNHYRHLRDIEHQVSQYDFRWTDGIKGTTIAGKVVGIFGTGRIGSLVAKYFKALGAHILAYDINPDSSLKDIVDYQSTPEAVYKEADIITLHMPQTESNTHQFNADVFKLFKTGAYFINTARGGLFDAADLIQVINDGKLSGAAIDTYEYEFQYIPRQVSADMIDDKILKQLIKHPKIYYSQHLAYFTDTSLNNMIIKGLNTSLELIQSGTTSRRLT